MAFTVTYMGNSKQCWTTFCIIIKTPLAEWFPSLQYSFRDLRNLCQKALKLFWQLMVAQHLTMTLCYFSFNMSPIYTPSGIPNFKYNNL